MASPWPEVAPLDKMKSIARKLVSKKKRRFKQHGFNLDLSYITPRIIAMGFPAEGAESLYRNDISEVLAFLSMFHNNHYKVFNLCAERTYDPAKLGGNVEWIPFSDHNPAPTEVMFHFCERAYDWLVADSSNVIVVHCKAGKGVTIASQRRYLCYFYDLWKHGHRNVVPLVISKMSFYSSTFCKCDIQICIACNGGNGSFQLNPILESERAGSVTNLVREGKFVTFFFSEVRILGDVKVMVYDGRASKPIFYFWFNTAFVDGKFFSLASRSELDKPSKSLDEDTKVYVYFSSRLLQKLTREDKAKVVDSELKTIEHLTKQLSAMNKVSSSMLK